MGSFASFAEGEQREEAFSRYIVTFNDDADVSSLLQGYEYRALSEDENVYLVEAEDVTFLKPYCVSSEPELSRDLLIFSGDESLENACNIYEAREISADPKDVTVAVLDTGVDREHPSLKGVNILEGYDATSDTAGVYTDEDGHGTAVIGIIAAENNGYGVTGVAGGVRIYPVKVSSGSGTVYSSALVAGIYNAVDNGADIINISLGGYSYSISEQHAVNYALSKGCIVIAAAGNDGANASLAGKYFYPASYEGVISVASVDADGAPSRFSQYNDRVTVAAPGNNITVCRPDGTHGVSSGTSLSAAIVSGIAALSHACAGELDGNQFKYLLMSVLGTNYSPYVGYGIIDAKSVVEASYDPIVTGIYNGAVLTAPTQIFFNKGTAKLDGKTFSSGDAVSEEGHHVFTLTYENKVVNISFTLSTEALDYSVSQNSIVFSKGYGYLDGMPYLSGAPIPNGYHSFVLKSEHKTISSVVNIGLSGYIRGVEHGENYSSAVAVTAYGNGSFTINGIEFSGTKVLSDGEYTAVATDLSGALTYSCSFTVKTDNRIHPGFGYESVIFAENEYGYLVVADGISSSFRVYDISHLSAPLRTVRTDSEVLGFEKDGENLYIILESAVYSVPHEQLKGSSAPRITRCEDYVSGGGYVVDENSLYFDGQKILTTPYGKPLAVRDNLLFTSQGCVDINSGRLESVFFDRAVAVTDNFVLFENAGLVEYTDILHISAASDISEVGYSDVFNDYTSFACLSFVPEQIVTDMSCGKIFMLSGGTVHYTDISFITSETIPLNDIPLYIAAGGGKLALFFRESCLVLDSNTFEPLYRYDMPCPQKALVGYYGIAACYENALLFAFDGEIVSISDIAVSDIDIAFENVYVANSEGIGVFTFDGSYVGSISSGDTNKVFTDGVYIASRDTVYLVSDGSVVSRIPAEIISIMNGLVFTVDGVYSPEGVCLSDHIFTGAFSGGFCVTGNGASLTVHGSAMAGNLPQIQNGSGMFYEYADIYSDLGVLYIDGIAFNGGKCNVGGKHRLECVMPFGIIYSSEFSIVPALSGISVSGGNRELNLGESQYILVEYLPEGASAVTAEFSVTGNSVTVDQNGLMTAVSEGTSLVTVSAGGFSASIVVTVTKLEISFTDVRFVYNESARIVSIPAGITAEHLADAVADKDVYFIVLDSLDEVVNEDEILSTGMSINFLSDTGESIGRVPIVVRGDLDCDGMLTASDMRMLSDVINGDNLNLHSFYAGDCVADGILDRQDKSQLLSLIMEFSENLPAYDNSLKVTASIPATLHPASEFSVVLYVDGGIGMDSVWGSFAFDDNRLEFVYMAGLDYKVDYSIDGGVISFAAYESSATPSDRVIKAFAEIRLRVKADTDLSDMNFKLRGCAATVDGSVVSSADSVMTAYVKKRTSADFSIKINNAEYFVFNPAIRSYSVTVPYDTVALDIEFDYPDGGIVILSDTVIPEKDELTVNIKYTSPSGVSTVYKILVIREKQAVLSNDPFLESIFVSEGELTPAFIPERLKYKLNLSYDAPVPEFTALARHEGTVVTAEIPESFPVGETDVLFYCVAEDGTAVTYTVTVVRAEQEISHTSADSSSPEPYGNGNLTFAIIAGALILVTAIVLIIIVIIRKGKNNVQKDF